MQEEGWALLLAPKYASSCSSSSSSLHSSRRSSATRNAPPLHPPFKMSLPNYNPGLAAPAQGTLPGSAGARTKP